MEKSVMETMPYVSTMTRVGTYLRRIDQTSKMAIKMNNVKNIN